MPPYDKYRILGKCHKCGDMVCVEDFDNGLAFFVKIDQSKAVFLCKDCYIKYVKITEDK